MSDDNIRFLNDDRKPNWIFIGVTVAMCFIFGALQWLFLRQVQITGQFESWVVRAALMLSVILTGVMIFFKFGRANTVAQDVVLWLGLVVEMFIMAFTFVVVIHPGVLAGTDIELFAKFVSGLNAITTVCTLIVYFAFDAQAKNAHKLEKERQSQIYAMQQTALQSPVITDMVNAAVQQQVAQQLAKDLGVTPAQLKSYAQPSRNGASPQPESSLPKA